MHSAIQRIAISTGGGDAPGLNAVIRAIVYAAQRLGWECVGIREGFNGLLQPERFAGAGLLRLTLADVELIGHTGGTLLGTTNRGNPLAYPTKMPDGSIREIDRCADIHAAMQAEAIDALICIGGDGTLTIAHALYQQGLRVIGVPKTIDNDLDKTHITFGFDTAVSFATECIDRLHSTADSHRRVMIVEVMGRYAGWIALHAGIAANAHMILLPEIPYDLNVLARHLVQRQQAGKHYALVVAAEGAHARDTPALVQAGAQGGQLERLGGIGERLAHNLSMATGLETRAVVLGHLLRGGSPTAYDRVAAMRFGAAAVRALAEGQNGIMVALAHPNVNFVELAEVAGRMKAVPMDGDTVQTARDLGICFGD